MKCENMFFHAAIIALLAALLLSACAPKQADLTQPRCTHRWQEATCQAPKTCALCGLMDGATVSHHWADTTCTSATPCSMCGTVEGMELTHQWRDDARVCVLCGLDERPADVRFVEKLGQSLDERWALMGELPWYAVKTREEWETIVDAEYALMAEFGGAVFEDADFGELAAAYVATIVSTKESLVGFGTDAWETEYINWGRHEQNALLYKINLISPIAVQEENHEKLQELISSGETVVVVNPLLDRLRIHNVDTVGSTYYYEIIAENITESNFSSFTYVLDFCNADGTVLHTENVRLTRWGVGEKLTYRFSMNSRYDDFRVRSVEWQF